MIANNELRIGNLVTCYNVTFKVTAINLTHVEGSLNDGEYAIEDLIGIELTEDILLKLGFEKISKGSPERWFKPNYTFFRFIKWKTYNTIHMSSCNKMSYSIKYVHQLQNIFFALTNCELDVSSL